MAAETAEFSCSADKELLSSEKDSDFVAAVAAVRRNHSMHFGSTAFGLKSVAGATSSGFQPVTDSDRYLDPDCLIRKHYCLVKHWKLIYEWRLR